MACIRLNISSNRSFSIQQLSTSTSVLPFFQSSIFLRINFIATRTIIHFNNLWMSTWLLPLFKSAILHTSPSIRPFFNPAMSTSISVLPLLQSSNVHMYSSDLPLVNPSNFHTSRQSQGEVDRDLENPTNKANLRSGGLFLWVWGWEGDMSDSIKHLVQEKPWGESWRNLNLFFFFVIEIHQADKLQMPTLTKSSIIPFSSIFSQMATLY